MATFAAQPKPDFAIWEVPGRSRRIVYSTALMRQLAAEVNAASQSEPGGGDEIGGILFGTADDYEVRIVAHRPIRCGHANGREFLLSSEDERALRAQVSASGNDPQLGGLVVVGWFHSHTRTPICLTAEDMRLWEIYFPMPWQVALVLRPQQSEPTRAGFFFRPASGPVRTDSSYRVFEADAEAPATPVHELASAVDAGQNAPASPPQPDPQPQPEPQPPAPEELVTPPPELLWQEPKRSRRPLWLVAALIAIAGAAGGFALFLGQNATVLHTTQPDLDLRLINEGGQLYATWDKQSRFIANAIRGSLEMASGDKRTDVPLSLEALGSSRLPILQLGRDVRIRLILESLDAESHPITIEAAAYYLGRSDSLPLSTSPVPASPETREALAEIAALERQLADASAANDLLEREVAALDLEESAVDPAQATPPQLPAPVPPPVNTQTQASPAPPAAANAAVETPAPLTPPAPQPPAIQAPPPAPPPPPAYTGPRSGRIIWTGFLAPGASVTIDGRRASAGNVNAALPGVPVRLSVYPAEFTSSGISVFSANPRHSSGDVVEGRSARNGWMNTRYVFDTDRARDVQLAASPGEQEGYRNITLRGGTRPVAAVVIDWQVAQ
ncbi:MAG: hypothetical protein R2762_03725 [Bryobacteraceae bacterium]